MALAFASDAGIVVLLKNMAVLRVTRDGLLDIVVELTEVGLLKLVVLGVRCTAVFASTVAGRYSGLRSWFYTWLGALTAYSI